MTQSYSVFQTDDASVVQNPSQPRRRLQAFGFLGRVLEGTGIVAVTLTMAMVALTTTARADTLLADTSNLSGSVVGLALIAVFVVMLTMVRKTWRQANTGIQNAPRRLHRIA